MQLIFMLFASLPCLYTVDNKIFFSRRRAITLINSTYFNLNIPVKGV